MTRALHPAQAYDRPALAERREARPKAAKHICKIARTRVYEIVADPLGLFDDQTHTSVFDLQTRRRAKKGAP